MYRNSSEDKLESAQWARKLLDSPKKFVILDTETTGLYQPEIVQISIVQGNGNCVLNTNLKPLSQIELKASQIHGLSAEILKDSPSFPEVYEQIVNLTKNKLVVMYNAGFDTKALFHTCKLHQLPRIKIETDCVMEWYAQWYGQYHEYYGNYTWQKLPNAKHDALGDCLAVRDLLKKMSSTRQIYKPKIIMNADRLFPPKQIACRWDKFMEVDFNFRDWSSKYEYCRREATIKFRLPIFYWMTDSEKKSISDEDNYPF